MPGKYKVGFQMKNHIHLTRENTATKTEAIVDWYPQ